ncbi:MAG: PAS domain-containing protein [Flavobacteriales bacterium]|nr:PAS domain-containing protein [Flavobacteriales bacterium]
MQEVQELLIQANPGDLVVITAEDQNEVEVAFAEGADEVILSPPEERNFRMFEARWLRRNSGYDLTAQVVLDESGKIVRWNREFLLLSGFPLSELREMSFSDLADLSCDEILSEQLALEDPTYSGRPQKWVMHTSFRKDIEVPASSRLLKSDERKELEITLLDLNNRRQSRTYRTTQLLNDIARSSPIIISIYDLRLKKEYLPKPVALRLVGLFQRGYSKCLERQR